jgi:hypothetical protein
VSDFECLWPNSKQYKRETQEEDIPGAKKKQGGRKEGKPTEKDDG